MKQKPILCYALIFKIVPIVEKFIAAMAQYHDVMDLVLVENASENADAIRAIVQGYDGRFVIGHFVFDQNITFNAMQCAIDDGPFDASGYRHVIVTDGDLLPAAGWLEEIVTILSLRKEVYCCGLGLNLSNQPAPLKKLPQFQIPEYDRGIYLDTRLGWWLTVFPLAHFQEFFAYRQAQNLLLHDAELYRFAAQQKGMVTAKAKTAIAYHMTWDYFDAIYRDEKYALTDPWNHDVYCGYVLHRTGLPSQRFAAKFLPPHVLTRTQTLVVRNVTAEAFAVRAELHDTHGRHQRSISLAVPPLGQASAVLTLVGTLKVSATSESGRSFEVQRLLGAETPRVDILLKPETESVVRTVRFTDATALVQLERGHLQITDRGLMLLCAGEPTPGGRVVCRDIDLAKTNLLYIRASLESVRVKAASFRIAFSLGDGAEPAFAWEETLRQGEVRLFRVPIPTGGGKYTLAFDTFVARPGEVHEGGVCRFEAIDAVVQTAGGAG